MKKNPPADDNDFLMLDTKHQFNVGDLVFWECENGRPKDIGYIVKVDGDDCKVYWMCERREDGSINYYHTYENIVSFNQWRSGRYYPVKR